MSAKAYGSLRERAAATFYLANIPEVQKTEAEYRALVRDNTIVSKDAITYATALREQKEHQEFRFKRALGDPELQTLVAPPAFLAPDEEE